MRARRSGGDALHSGNAAAAASMARSTSALLANATVLAERPSDGVYTWPERPDVPSTTCPPMKWGTVSAAAAAGRAGSTTTELFVGMVVFLYFPLRRDRLVEDDGTSSSALPRKSPSINLATAEDGRS